MLHTQSNHLSTDLVLIEDRIFSVFGLGLYNWSILRRSQREKCKTLLNLDIPKLVTSQHKKYQAMVQCKLYIYI